MPRIMRTGVEINYDVWGDASPAMVLVHANPFDNTLWLYQIAHFSTYFKVISVDLRGYGRSSKIESEFTIKDLSEDVVAVCRESGVKEAIFGGISVGSAVVEQLAADHQEMVRALIVVGLGFFHSGRPKLFAEKRVNGYSAGIGYRETHIRSLISEEFQKTELGKYLISMYLERNSFTNPTTITRLFQGFAKWDQPKELELFKFPVLIAAGEEDSALKAALELHERISHSELSIITKAGHACCLEKPWEFDEAVMKFLKRNNLLSL